MWSRTFGPACSFSDTFSPTVVVALSGPGLEPFSAPNFAQAFRSATLWFTNVRFSTRRILLVIYSKYEMNWWYDNRIKAYLDLFTVFIRCYLDDCAYSISINSFYSLRMFCSYNYWDLCHVCNQTRTKLLYIVCPRRFCSAHESGAGLDQTQTTYISTGISWIYFFRLPPNFTVASVSEARSKSQCLACQGSLRAKLEANHETICNAFLFLLLRFLLIITRHLILMMPLRRSLILVHTTKVLHIGSILDNGHE